MNDLKIEIVNDEVFTRTIKTKDGRTFEIREQKAFLHSENTPYPKEFNLKLYDAPAFKVGFYNLLSACYYIDKYNNLSLKNKLSLSKMD